MFYTRILLTSWRKKTRSSVINPRIIPTSDLPKWKIAAKVFNHKLDEYSTTQLIWYAGLGLLSCFLGFLFQLSYTQYKWRTSDTVQIALNILNQQSKLIYYLGPPLKVGWVYPNEKNSISSNIFYARIPISGTYLEGYLNIDAKKQDNFWEIHEMTFAFTDKAGGIVQLVRNCRQC